MDRLLVGKALGLPLLLLLLAVIVWLTVWGANYPSELLEMLLDRVHQLLKGALSNLPPWISGITVDGMYATSARVLSVMLPPMAIFFPLFTLLEDVGYLPRMALLLDGGLRKCGGCGKQALTMCMGLGCNAVGVTGCRIIDSPRERRIAILTNAMIPCNGRFPTLIVLASLFFSSTVAAFGVAISVVFGVLGAMAVTSLLSHTVLRHEKSVFLMEIPPLRKPQFARIVVRSLIDRTASIALRALKVAAPSGAILWLLANTSALSVCAELLDPFGRLLGMNGMILLAFILSFPANELFIPVILMAITGFSDLHSVGQAGVELLLDSDWTVKTALCTMIFTVFHWPCVTTLMTIHKETGSLKETAAAFCLPTAVGMLLCIVMNQLL